MPCRQLQGVDIDRSEREIYMPIAATAAMMPPEALLLVDYDNNNVGEQEERRGAGRKAVVSSEGGPVSLWLALQAGSVSGNLKPD